MVRCGVWQVVSIATVQEHRFQSVGEVKTEGSLEEELGMRRMYVMA